MAVVRYLIQLYIFILLARIVLSWFPTGRDGFVGQLQRVLYALTEPVLGPMRAVVPPVRMGAAALDLSPLIVFFGLQILLAVLPR